MACVGAHPLPLYRLSLGMVAWVLLRPKAAQASRIHSEDGENGPLLERFETQGVLGWQEWPSQT